ncbi:sodium-potassium/proton antiporter ChaA, partial [Cronobacter sakazakii]
MSAQESVRTRHKESSLVLPLAALVILWFWGASESLPAIIGINLLALVAILS